MTSVRGPVAGTLPGISVVSGVAISSRDVGTVCCNVSKVDGNVLPIDTDSGWLTTLSAAPACSTAFEAFSSLVGSGCGVNSGSLTVTDELGAVVPTAIFQAESKMAVQENDVGDEGTSAGGRHSGVGSAV